LSIGVVIVAVVGADYDVDEAFDETDLCVDGEPTEAEMSRHGRVLAEGRSFCPSTDVIIVMENTGNCKQCVCSCTRAVFTLGDFIFCSN